MRDRRPAAVRGASLAAPLGAVWLAVVVYASLFPFAGWRWPAGMAGSELLRLPWPRYFIPFDIVSNLLAYLPLGALLALGLFRQGVRPGWAWLLAALAAAAVSYGLEVLQHLLPPRVPSLLDWALNAGGAALGALLARAALALGLLRGWERWRSRWLEEGSAGAMALLLLWPVALLFPAPVPLGLGQVAGPLQALLRDLLADVPWAAGLSGWLALDEPAGDHLSRAGQLLAVMLGMLAPGLLAFTSARRGWQRLWLALGAAVLGLAGTTLSTALNFGPDHAFAWWSLPIGVAIGLGLLLTVALVRVGQRVTAGLGLVVITGLVTLVNQAPTDPYLLESLQAWEQGQFIRFHGLAQWVGWLWPYGAMAWLLARLARRGG